MDTKQQGRFNNHLIENREVRIFLSSTFSDMEEERAALVKTFNVLKINANRRSVSLSILDLRWGVTEEESKNGKVLSVCLNEIEHSHPFFIGLLGSRYGYTPQMDELDKNPELEERYPWIREDINRGLSITEMEMQYGVLRNRKDIDAAFFIKKTPGMISDDSEHLSRLKNEIRNQKRFIVDEYYSIEDLCKKIEDSIINILNKHFPETTNTRVEQERTAQNAYMNSRHDQYVKKQEDFDRLNKFLENKETHLVITGISGMGKSALIANWLKELKQRKEKIPLNIIYHFVGNSFAGNDYVEILQHITDEIYDLYNLTIQERSNEKLEKEAQRVLLEAIQNGLPLLIVIDGINQITDCNNCKLLNWLPQSSHGVKYLFSTLQSDETMQTFLRRGYPIHTIVPLNYKNRQMFVTKYLANVGKKLTVEQFNRIIHDPKNENTLVLKTLLDELICFGSYEKLDERINFYLAASSINDFFDRVLQRVEEDYMNVDYVLSLIAVSEHGLSEEELIAITKLRPMDWHLFYCAFYNHFVIRNNLITFAHQYITDAVWKRYQLQDITSASPYRKEIIQFFTTSNEITNDRKISEVAHQYYYNHDYPNLCKTILSFDSFDSFYKTNKGKMTLFKYWQELIQYDSERYSLSSYLNLPCQNGVASFVYIDIGSFVQSFFADSKIAMKYLQTFHNYWTSFTGDTDTMMAYYYYEMGCLCCKQEKYAEALDNHFKALSINEEKNGRERDVAKNFNAIGLVYDNQGDHKKALDYYFKALAIREKMNDGDALIENAVTYNNMGSCYNGLGDSSNAMEYHYRALRIKEDILGHENLSTADSYNNIAFLYDDQGDFHKSLEFYNIALAIYEKILGVNHRTTGSCYNNIGQVYFHMKKYSLALDYYTKSHNIAKREFGSYHTITATSYYNIGFVNFKLGNYQPALESYSMSLDIFSRLLGNNHPNVQQVNDSINCVDKLIADRQPIFPGGNTALSNYIGSNVHYPKVAESKGIQGKVLVSFVIERDGSITNISIVNSMDPLLDQELLRVVGNMPHWLPGKANGKPTRYKYTIPISFKL